MGTRRTTQRSTRTRRRRVALGERRASGHHHHGPQSKGLEYEVVFCPFLWQARPVERPPVLAHVAEDRVVYDCGSDHLDRHRALAETERLAEDLRLTYVALTRARRRMIVAWGAIGRGTASAASALAYLLHRRQGRLTTTEQGPIDEATWVEASIREVKGAVEGWRDDLAALVAAHPDRMALADVPDQPVPVTRRDVTDEAVADLRPLAVPAVAWDRLVPWRISSFSSLARGGEREAPDHADPSAISARTAADHGEPQGLFAFARGPRAGDCLHRIFESIDFRRLGRPDVVTAARRELERSRLDDPAQHPAPLDPERAVLDMLDAVLGSPLPLETFALAEIGRAERLVEWSFHITLAPIVPCALADIFRRHASTPWAHEYADRLERLGRQRIEGFLTGFVDLVFERDGRWFIVDWKSNYLGDHSAAYGQDAMTSTMIEHHYILQYHLYLVALRRFLRERSPSFDARRDLGGAFYIFLRGVERRAAPTVTPASRQLDLFAEGTAPTTTGDDTTRGIFRDRPAPELLDALEAWL
ncbi:MAG: PD-(D/E)XK nuclease family protein, partial [Acidobacteriota bacterium]